MNPTALASPPGTRARCPTRTIDSALLAAALRAEPALVLVDVRSPDAFFGSELGHVPGSLLVPFEHLLAEASTLGAIGAPLVLVCEDGRRAEQGARMLTAAGVAHVAALEGGLRAWRSLGLPVHLDG